MGNELRDRGERYLVQRFGDNRVMARTDDLGSVVPEGCRLVDRIGADGLPHNPPRAVAARLWREHPELRDEYHRLWPSRVSSLANIDVMLTRAITHPKD
jgi:hypothetical protein